MGTLGAPSGPAQSLRSEAIAYVLDRGRVSLHARQLSDIPALAVTSANVEVTDVVAGHSLGRLISAVQVNSAEGTLGISASLRTKVGVLAGMTPTWPLEDISACSPGGSRCGRHALR